MKEFSPVTQDGYKMADSLNVVALISGGKDSLYSLLHCLQNGHKIVALANLYPKAASLVHTESSDPERTKDSIEDDDINSFMYQTVGHSIIPLYAEALQLPLYRREITGSAVQTSRDYAYSTATIATSVEQDETEDLMPLLRTVLQNHPEVNAVNTGAIQSTYQRTRIESVALRLGLTPLAYLWQYPVLPPPLNPRTGQVEREDSTTSLLDDMASAGCESRIIKIASGGIKESLLWADLTNSKTRTQLIAGLRRFFAEDELGLRGAVVGEGGEFESLALSGPRILWKGGRIVIDDGALETIDGEGGASFVQIRAAGVVAHDTDVDMISRSTEGEEADQVRVPGLFDQQFETIRQSMCSLQPGPICARLDAITAPVSSNALYDQVAVDIPNTQYNFSTTSVQIANITYLSQGREPASNPGPSAAEQMQLIAACVPGMLSEISIANNINAPLISSAIVSSMLVLRKMSDFADINPIYATMFEEGVPIPPARVTVAAALPEGIEVMLSLVLDRGERQRRRGLHVQGRSYWAPANIGPYSQAVAVPYQIPSEANDFARSHEVVHVAGQIPLIPASMDILDASFAEQSILSLQHLWRIGQERKVDRWGSGVAFLPRAQPSGSMDEKVVIAGKVWRDANMATVLVGHADSLDEEEDIDVWHIQNNRTSSYQEAMPKLTGQHLHPLPSLQIKSEDGRSCVVVPAFIAAEVTALPRNASIEWWSTGLTGLASAQQGLIAWEQFPDGEMLTLSSSQPGGGSTSFVACLIPSSRETGKIFDDAHLTAIFERICSHAENKTRPEITTGTAFVTVGATKTWKTLTMEWATSMQDPRSCVDKRNSQFKSRLNCLPVVLCHRLWGYNGVQAFSEVGDDTVLRPEQLDLALIFRVDTRPS